MTIAGAFLGSGVELVPAGYCLLKLQVVTSDRQDMSGATFTVSATGQNTQTVTADASGRAEVTVAAGHTYTVSLIHTGSYFNDESQTVIAESATTKFVYFDLINDESAEVYHNLSASSWSADTTYPDFPFKCDIAITGVTAEDYAEVTFSMDDAMSGDFAPICETVAGGVRIFSEKNETTTIPTIFIRRD